MYIFERLISSDYQKVYYIMKSINENRFYFFTQDEKALEEMCAAKNPIDTMLDIYTSLIKTKRINIANKDFEEMRPIRSHFYCFFYHDVSEQMEKRTLEGKRTRVRLSS